MSDYTVQMSANESESACESATTERGSVVVVVPGDDPTWEEWALLMEQSGAFDFWNDPAEEVYDE